MALGRAHTSNKAADMELIVTVEQTPRKTYSTSRVSLTVTMTLSLSLILA